MSQVTVEQLDGLVKELADARIEKEHKKNEVSLVDAKINELEAKTQAYLTELNRKSYKSPHGTVSIRESWRVNLPKGEEDRSKFFEFLKSEGIFDKLISVNSQTLNSLYMEYWKNAQKDGELSYSMPGIGEPKLFQDISFRKTT